MIIDTHAHYDHKQFNQDRTQLLGSLADAGISHVINVGSSLATSRASVKLAEAYPNIYATIGTHPHYADEMTQDILDEMVSLAAHPKVVAIGEIGLDYYRNNSPPEVQREWFRRQLEATAHLNLPYVIHCRDAFADTIEIMREFHVSYGVVHSFSGTVDEALQYLTLEMHIGINGVVTFKGADELCRVVKMLPHDRFVLETDCPYLSPHPNRGKRNDSTNLTHVAEKVGEVMKKRVDWVERVSSENAQRLFRIG